jgi:hypothetical protein
VYEHNPHYDPSFYNFSSFYNFEGFYDSGNLYDFSGFYHFRDFYDFHQSYDSFKEYASWRPQTVAEVTDMSARLGMRGAFEMLVRFEGQTLEEKMEFHDSWYQIVERYSTRKLTFDRDRVPAIQGIAYFIAKDTKFKFTAGLWIEFLPFNLLWVLKGSPQKRPDPPRLVPTWSWASVDVSDDGNISHLLSKPSKTTSGTAWKEIKILISDIDVGPMPRDTLELTCHLFKLDLGKVEFIPDVIIPQHSTDEPEPDVTPELTYLPILSLKTASFYGPKRQQQLHGIVLQAKPSADDKLEFQRVGYFWTAERDIARGILGSLGSQHDIRLV